MAKRRWTQYPKRIANELNGMAGIGGVGGTILSVVSLVGLSGSLAIVLASVGTVIAGGAVSVAAWKAVPPKPVEPTAIVGKKVAIGELDNIHPPILAIGIVGPSMAGKSTLLSRIIAAAPPNERTVGVFAQIATLNTSPTTFVALLDGGGSMYADQFAVAAPSSFLCILVDHNPSDSATAIDEHRVHEHVQFSEQLRGYLQRHKKNVRRVHMVLNKRDLWEDDPNRAQLETQFHELVQSWRQSSLAEHVTFSKHSNQRAEDVVGLLQEIMKHVVVQ